MVDTLHIDGQPEFIQRIQAVANKTCGVYRTIVELNTHIAIEYDASTVDKPALLKFLWDNLSDDL